jgi:hypothetical protein
MAHFLLDEDSGRQIRGDAHPRSVEADDQATLAANHAQQAALADSEVAQPRHGPIVEGEKRDEQVAAELSGSERDRGRSGALVGGGHRLSPSRMEGRGY